MRTPHVSTAVLTRTLTGLVVAGLLLLGTGCVYDQHRNMGATEKLEASELHTVPKIILFPFVAIGDSLISPFTMLCDQVSYDEQYDPRHHYFSYSGSRVIGRSHMGLGWQWVASVPSIIIETFWFLITGPVDLITVLATGDEGYSEE